MEIKKPNFKKIKRKLKILSNKNIIDISEYSEEQKIILTLQYKNNNDNSYVKFDKSKNIIELL